MNYGVNYDSIVITLILVADLGSFFLLWIDQTNKQRARSARKFNKILKSLGMAGTTQ